VVIAEITKKWVETFVVKLNLCPFAKAELLNDRIRFSVCNAQTEGALLSVLKTELELLIRPDKLLLLVFPMLFQL